MMSRFSDTCPVCGRVDDLTTVKPTGVHCDRAVLWQCKCGNTRSIEIDRYTPQVLVRRAMRADEMRKEAREAAIARCAKALKKEDAQTARWLLDKIGFENFAKQNFNDMVNPDLPPTTLPSVIDEMAERRVNEFLDEKSITGAERLKLYPLMKAKELAALKEEFACEE